LQSPDVNILVYAHREETPHHQRYADWLIKTTTSKEPFALSELVISGFLRIVTNPKIFKPVSSIRIATSFISEITTQPNCQLIRAESQHFQIFLDLCKKYDLKGKLIADAYHAALAIEHGLMWVSADTDFSIFQEELRFKHL
jgi:toxin-antitoxin system PIN domain toxin